MKNVTGPVAAEAAIQVTKNLIDLATTQNPPKANGVNSFTSDVKKVKICFDEWNVWDPNRADGTKGAEEQYTVSDALAVASWLNVFVRQSESLGMCNIAQVVNVIAPIMTNETSMFLQTTYFPLKLFSNFMRGKSLNLHVETPTYEGDCGNNDGLYTWIKGNYMVPILDVSAVQNGEFTYVAIVNRDEKQDSVTKISFASKVKSIYKWELYDEDVTAYNDFATPDRIGIKEEEMDIGGEETIEFKFPKHSFTMIRVKY